MEINSKVSKVKITFQNKRNFCSPSHCWIHERDLWQPLEAVPALTPAATMSRLAWFHQPLVAHSPEEEGGRRYYLVGILRVHRHTFYVCTHDIICKLHGALKNIHYSITDTFFKIKKY